MKEETADALTENMGELRDDYSGRGMNGKSTFAVTFDSQSEFQEALVHAAFRIGWQSGNDDEEALKDLVGLRMDSMGLGIVVY